MSGRGGRGGWRGRGRGGRGGPPQGPVARDDEGNIVDSQPAGPPPLFPIVELPHHPDQAARDTLLLIKRHDLSGAAKRTPFFVETKEAKKEDVESVMDQYLAKSLVLPAPTHTSTGSATAAGHTKPQQVTRKRMRDPLTSVIKLLPEYFPEELFTSSDRKHAKVSDNYWKRAGRKDDSGLDRLDALAAREEREGGEGGGGGQGGDDRGEGEIEEEVRDTDDEEDMEQDDYYQGEHFDDDEGYDDGMDDGGGGDEGGFF